PSVPPPAVAGRNSAPGTTVAPGMASSTALPLSVIDFATVRPGQAVGDALRDSVALAQKSEELGYDRVWYAEHHNMGSIASSSPAVLMAHIASQTSSIRLGSGGVMLPNQDRKSVV